MGNDLAETPPAKAVVKHAGEKLSGLARLVPQNFTELEHIAQILGKSDIVPKDLVGKPANILLAMMFGNEIGLTPAQSLQSVMIVNGRPSLWGDAVMGLVESSGLQDAWTDKYDPAIEGGIWAFTTKRRGRDPVTRTFSMKDAIAAKLDKKPGPWQEYTKRMLFNRARAFALRDVYPDVLKGIRIFEEERDVIDLQTTQTKTYAMPGAAESPVEKTAAPAAAAAAPTPAPVVVPQTDKPVGDVIELQVSGAATTDFDGNPDCFVIRDRSEPAIKYYSDSEAYFTLAKAAKESGAKLAGIWTEKPSGKTKVRWLLALTQKG